MNPKYTDYTFPRYHLDILQIPSRHLKYHLDVLQTLANMSRAQATFQIPIPKTKQKCLKFKFGHLKIHDEHMIKEKSEENENGNEKKNQIKNIKIRKYDIIKRKGKIQ